MLKIGAAEIDITPPLGTHLAGAAMGERRPARSILDPLFARAAVFAAGDRQVAVVALDTIAITRAHTDRIRDGARRLGFEPDAVLVHALQNHSAPSVGGLMLDPDYPLERSPELEYLDGTDGAYSRRVADAAVAAIEQASRTLQPAQVGAGRAVRDDLAFNRRAITRGGQVRMPWFYSGAQKPLGPTDICYLEGPADPEVGVWAARTDASDLPLTLLHFTCHPVNLFATDHHVVSADWPGAWAAALRARRGARTVPLVLNGCCGNINPWPAFTPDFRPDHRRMGDALAETADRVLRQLRFAPTDRLDWRTVRLGLDYRDIPAARLAEVNRILTDHPAPQWQDQPPHAVDPTWFLAASTRSAELVRRRWPKFPYEIQVFRIGDTAIVSLPGEPFVEGQLAIKTGSPAAHTFVAHMTTQYVGYVPTREACARAGHESNDLHTYWAKLAPDSLDRIVAQAKTMLRELFAD